MILSKNLMLSDEQAIVADAISSNVIDLGVPGTVYQAAAPFNQDTGKGTPVPILIQVVEAFNTLTSLTITLETSDAANLSGSTVLATETILLADLKVGKTTFMQYLPNGVTGRYLGLRYNVNGTDPTLGKVTAGISAGNQTNFTGV